MNAIAINADYSLGGLDWRIVEIARLDGPRSMNPDGRLARFLRNVVGVRIPRALANDKLEALRRFCVRAWYWDFVRPQDVRPLMEAGYTSLNVVQILAHVAERRGFAPSIVEDFT
jgi:hypothetical protein